MPTRLFPAWVYYIAVAVLVVLVASTYYNRVPHFDDAWNAEQAYWLWRDGYVHSSFFAEPQQPNAQIFVFHKGFIYAQSFIAGPLGFGIYAVKTTALLFALATLILLIRYFRNSSPEAQWLAATLYLGCGTLMQYSFVNRAETMVMACGFGSFMLLRTSRHYALAGVLAGVAALAHLNGTVYLAVGALWLLWQKAGWRAIGYFALAGKATLSLYFVDALVTNKLPLLIHQFTQVPVTHNNLNGWTKLLVMLNYQEIFMHSEGEMPLTIVLIVVLLLAWPLVLRSQAKLSPAMRYLALLFLCFWLLTARTAAYYYLLFLPFIIVVVVELAVAIAPQLRLWSRRALLTILALYPIGSLVEARNLWLENRCHPAVVAENAQLATHMPRHGSKAVVPLNFFFGQVQNYRSRSLTYYALLNELQYHNQLSVPAFFRLMAQDSVTYVVTDHAHNQAFYVPLTAPKRIGKYKRVFEDRWYSIYCYVPLKGHL